MLILILVDVQYSQNAVFSFEKCANHENHSSSGFHLPVKNSLISKISYHPLPPPPPPPSFHPLLPIWKTLACLLACLCSYTYSVHKNILCIYYFANVLHTQRVYAYWKKWLSQIFFWHFIIYYSKTPWIFVKCCYQEMSKTHWIFFVSCVG